MNIESFTLWAPGLENNKEDWISWQKGEKEIDNVSTSPKLTFASSIVTRRFSQLTKMTCFVTEKIGMDVDGLFFSSIRGEIAMQYKINRAFAETNEMKPATFAISVFNTAPAEATILLNSKVPYTPLFSGEKDCIKNLWTTSTSAILSGRMKSVLLVYAEEHTPDEYADNLRYGYHPPLCVAVKVSNKNGENIPSIALETPEDFIKYLINNKDRVWI